MESVAGALLAGAAAFVATNLDDLFLLVAWFAAGRIATRDIVAGQYLGIDALFAERQFAIAHAEEFLYDTLNRSRDVDLPLFEPRIPDLTRRMADAGIWQMTTLTAYKNIGLMAENLARVLARPEMRYLPQAARVGWGPATNPYTRRFGPDKAPGIFARLALQQAFSSYVDRYIAERNQAPVA